MKQKMCVFHVIFHKMKMPPRFQRSIVIFDELCYDVNGTEKLEWLVSLIINYASKCHKFDIANSVNK